MWVTMGLRLSLRITDSTRHGLRFNCKSANFQSGKPVMNERGHVHKTLAATMKT